MTLGQKIKQARIAANLTQKDLANELSVTFQTVSKWESDTNEPDLTTLRGIAKILNVSLEYLVSDEEAPAQPKPQEAPKPQPQTIHARRQLGTCADCHKPVMEGDYFHNVERRSPSGVKETVMVCDPCFQRHEEEIRRRAKEVEDSMKPKPEEKKKGIFHKITDRDDRKPLIWAIIIGVVAAIIALIIFIINVSTVGVVWTIFGPLLIGYALTATIYCIFTASFISEVFMSVASWSIHFPGIIFSWDIEGLAFLIAMKVFFAILGAVLGVLVFLLALSLSALLSVFAFVPLLIYNKTHYGKEFKE